MAINGTEGAGTVPAVFRQTVARLGDRTALRHKALGLWNDTSWRQYLAQAEQVGAALMAMGLEKGDRVAIIGDNCPAWVVADLGTQCAGGVSVGVYATNAWQQVAYVIEHSDARIFFVENEEQLDKWLHFKDQVPTLEAVVIWDTEGLRDFTDSLLVTWDELLKKGAAALAEDPEMIRRRGDTLTPEDLAVLIYTSGTTGPPKGAMLSHGNVTWMADAESLPPQPRARSLQAAADGTDIETGCVSADASRYDR